MKGIRVLSVIAAWVALVTVGMLGTDLDAQRIIGGRSTPLYFSSPACE
jgi:hypothetical protein